MKAAKLQAAPAAQEIKVICLAAGVAAGVALIPLKNILAPRQLELSTVNYFVSRVFYNKFIEVSKVQTLEMRKPKP
jgi:hypothetical protein